MPLFEYQCQSCGGRFEYLTRQGQTPACPACASVNIEKQLSVFAVSAAKPPQRTASLGPCGSCGDPRGPGACSIN